MQEMKTGGQVKGRKPTVANESKRFCILRSGIQKILHLRLSNLKDFDRGTTVRNLRSQIICIRFKIFEMWKLVTPKTLFCQPYETKMWRQLACAHPREKSELIATGI
jgi:hypothetical protein